MSEQQPEAEQDLTPQSSPILHQPATVEACQADYAAAADIRARLGWTDGTA